MDIYTVLKDVFRVGEVVSIDSKNCTAKVQFTDTDDFISGDLQVLQRKTQDDKYYYMPDVGELVSCIFLGNGMIAGFVLGAVYNSKDAAPDDVNENITCVKFKDDTRIEYDRMNHKAMADIKGDVEIQIDENEDAKGDLDVTVKNKAALKALLYEIIAEDGIKITTPVKTENADEFTVNGNEVNLNCSAVNLGDGADAGVVHDLSPCPLFGIFHLGSAVTKTAL